MSRALAKKNMKQKINLINILTTFSLSGSKKKSSKVYFICICRKIEGGQEIVIKIPSTGCKGQDNEINYLEHVQLYTTIEHNIRGKIEIYMKSPGSPAGMYKLHYLIRARSEPTSDL